MRRLRIPLVVLGLVLVVVVGGPFVYINLIKAEPAERLSLDDVTTTSGASAPSGDGIEGTWTTTDQSVVQYRVQEVLLGQDSEATGTSSGVTGSVVVVGSEVSSAEVEVDMTTFESGESRRDDQFEGRIMEVAQFPVASFSLTAPIDLGSEPADGEEVTVTATGDLTMHGVTRSITFDLTAKRTGSTFAANATIPITFSDYGIRDPSNSAVQLGDSGELELLLVFAR